MFFGLQAFWDDHFFSFSMAPCAYFFGLGCCDFLDLNRSFSHQREIPHLANSKEIYFRFREVGEMS